MICIFFMLLLGCIDETANIKNLLALGLVFLSVTLVFKGLKDFEI